MASLSPRSKRASGPRWGSWVERQGDAAYLLAAYGGDLAHAARRTRVGGAGFLGMSAEVLLGTHGHHHPDFLHGAANAITSKHRVSVVESVVDLEDAREKRQKAQ